MKHKQANGSCAAWEGAMAWGALMGSALVGHRGPGRWVGRSPAGNAPELAEQLASQHGHMVLKPSTLPLVVLGKHTT